MKPKRLRQGNLTTWAVPSMHASSALVIGLALPRLKTYFWPDLVSTMSAAAAMAICSAIAMNQAYHPPASCNPDQLLLPE